MLVEQLELERSVITNREFSGVPVGTPGKIIASSNSWPDTDSVAIAWDRRPGDSLVDWFSFDDLKYLDVELTNSEIRNSLSSLKCYGCDVRPKKRKMSHCSNCYYTLPPEIRRALYRRIGEGYEQAFRESIDYLRKVRST